MAKANLEILDPNCLLCSKPLSEPEVVYWNERIEMDKDTVNEPTIRRVSCVKCAVSRNKIIPKALQEKVDNYKPDKEPVPEPEPEPTPELETTSEQENISEPERTEGNEGQKALL